MRSRAPWLVPAIPLAALLLAPIVALLLRAAPAAVAQNLARSETRDAIAVSLKTSAVTATALLLFGTPFAYALGRRLPGRRLLEAFVTLPAVLPPAAGGIALLLAFGRHGLIPTRLPFSTGAVVLAQLFVSAAFYIRPLAGAFRAVPGEIEEAALLDGASAATVLLRCDLPLVRRTLLAALALAWARAIGEFGATILFAGNRPGVTQTLPLAIYEGFETDLDIAAGLSIVLLAVAIAILALTMLLDRDKPS